MIWSYLELFGRDGVRDVVLVEQTPLQLQTADWRKAHKQCFDQASCEVMLARMAADPAAFDAQNLDACVYRPVADAERGFLLDEMALPTSTAAHRRCATIRFATGVRCCRISMCRRW